MDLRPSWQEWLKRILACISVRQNHLIDKKMYKNNMIERAFRWHLIEIRSGRSLIDYANTIVTDDIDENRVR